jgi:inorganic pyrophosphatase
MANDGGQEPDEVVVVVEIPTGSRNKYEWDPEAGGLVLDRMLFTAMRYPADYGFIEGTLGEDGDPLDALVFVGEPTFPGCRIRARPVGLFKMWDERGPDEKVLCVPLRDPMWSHVRDLEDLLPTLRNEVEHFFAVYKDLEGKKTGVEGFAARDEALRVIAAARRRAASARPPAP